MKFTFLLEREGESWPESRRLLGVQRTWPAPPGFGQSFAPNTIPNSDANLAWSRVKDLRIRFFSFARPERLDSVPTLCQYYIKSPSQKNSLRFTDLTELVSSTICTSLNGASPGQVQKIRQPCSGQL